MIEQSQMVLLHSLTNHEPTWYRKMFGVYINL